MQSIPICTIASNYYLAFARVLAESHRQHHRDARVFVSVSDRPDASVPYSRMPFKTIFAEELPMPRFDNFAFR